VKRIAIAVLSILAVAALAAMTSGDPPCGQGWRKNETCVPATFAVSLTTAGTTVRMKWTIAATPSDSLVVQPSATGQPAVPSRMYLADSKTDSIDYPKPAPGASITLSLSGTNWYKGRSASAPVFSQTYVEPDTIVVKPSVTVQVYPQVSTISTTDSVIFTARVS